MKKLLFLLAITIFIGCDKDDDFVNGFSPETINKAHNLLNESGLKPKSIEDITYVRFVENGENAKYAGGVKGDAAWFAKFDTSGNELFSYTFPYTGSPEFCSYVNWYEVHNDLILVSISRNNEKKALNEFSYVTYSYCNSPVLCVIDKNTGKEISKIFSEMDASIFIGKANYHGCFVYEVASTNDRPNYLKMYFIDTKGKLSWERMLPKDEIEKDLQMKIVRDGTFISEENIIFYSNIDYSHHRVVNLKNYQLLYTIDNNDLNMTGELAGQSNILYRDAKWVSESRGVFFVYSEAERKKIIDDPASGAHHYEDIPRNRYAYEINPENGEIIGFGKYN